MDLSTILTTPANYNGTEDYTIDTIVCVAFGCLGMLDNGFVILVMLKANMIRKRNCNIFAFHQSVIDFIASFLVFFKAPSLTGLKESHGSSAASSEGVASQLYCRLWDSDYFFWVTMLASTYNIVVITADRYLEVVHPLRYTTWYTLKRAKMVLVGVWLIGFTLPVVVIVKPNRLLKEKDACFQNDYSISFAPWVVASCTITFIFILPVVVMLVCYVHMIRTFNSKTEVTPRNRIRTESERRRHERSKKIRRGLFRTMFMVSIFYVVCWIGDQLYFFLRIIGKVETQQDLRRVLKSLVYLNCCINPVIYSCQYHDFQKAVKANFVICKKSNEVDGTGKVTP